MDASAQQASRIVQILKLSFLVAGALFIFLVFRIPAQPRTAPSSALEMTISAVALICVCAAFFVPTILPISASSSSALDGSASAPVKKWLSRCVISLALLDACNVFAVVLHFLGARTQVVELVFAIGMLSLAFWTPGTPPNREQSTIAQS